MEPDVLLFAPLLYSDASEQAVFLTSCCGGLRQLLVADADSRKLSPDVLGPYIAAKLDSLPAIFMLGDEKKYNNYGNRALQGQQQYVCFILAELMHHESVSSSVHRLN